MLKRITIRNFKMFEEASIELDESVVLIGPNNSGKTSALQALTLWKAGLTEWVAKRHGKSTASKRTGVSINRTDLISLPVPSANLLWHNLRAKNVQRIDGRVVTDNVRIDIIVEGRTNGNDWKCGLEFDYANEQSFYCRPLRLTEEETPERMEIPEEAMQVKVAFLPVMSGLAATEPKSEPGRIDVLIGEGQTAQVLRNLCHLIHSDKSRNNGTTCWEDLSGKVKELFGCELLPPDYISARGELTMGYIDTTGIELDISASGRGFQQTLLLLAHLYANPGTILLLDEPDAHLEVLRQRQIFNVLTGLASKQQAQIIAASHSEVVLNEAAQTGAVVAFVGKPHRFDENKKRQVLESLRTIGHDQYYQAEQTGWILYLEGSTDLRILQAFATKLEHCVKPYLDAPLVHHVGNQPKNARRHFQALLEAKGDLLGLALFDRLDRDISGELGPSGRLDGMQWNCREVENYLCTERCLLAYAQNETPGELLGKSNQEVMQECIADMVSALGTTGKGDPWSPDIKATDDFLDPLFENYFNRIGGDIRLRKTNYHTLVDFLPADEIDGEVVEKLDAILAVAQKAVIE